MLSNKSIIAVAMFLISCGRSQEINNYQSKIYFDIKEASQYGNYVQNVSLLQNNLKSIPTEVFSLSNLKWLNISYNSIDSISNNICELQKLRTLDLMHNRLQTIQLGCLDSLKKLSLRSNLIRNINADIQKNRCLVYLDLGNNMIDSGIQFIGSLSNLEELYMDNCNLKEFPLELTRLNKLKKLDLSYNDLRDLPNEIQYLSNLEYLYIEETKIPKDRLVEIDSLMPNTTLSY